MCGKIRADADRRIIQNCPNGRGVCAPIHLFGSGLGHGLVRFVYLDPPGLISPLRTDSRQPVSKICWCVKTFGEMMNVPKRLEPTGFFSFAPACAGRFGWMRIGGSSKIARTAEGCVRRFTCLVPAWPAWGIAVGIDSVRLDGSQVPGGKNADLAIKWRYRDPTRRITLDLPRSKTETRVLDYLLSPLHR